MPRRRADPNPDPDPDPDPNPNAEKARRLADLRTPKQEEEAGGWNPFRALKGRGLQQCETSYDCDAPMVCRESPQP